jgi:hypothetical protein
VEPNWEPLENRLGSTRCVGFMYMGRINGINLYKHGITRTYIHLDDAGNCYIPMGNGCYASGDWEQELMLLEDCLKRLSATLETSYDAKFITEKRQKLQRKGISLLTLEVQPGDFTIH